jgi:hypothetical protein
MKEKYPEMDPASFYVKFKYAMQSKLFTKDGTFFVSQKVQNTKWFMVQSKEYVKPSKSPDDQITEFQNGAKHFWPHWCIHGGGGLGCQTVDTPVRLILLNKTL